MLKCMTCGDPKPSGKWRFCDHCADPSRRQQPRDAHTMPVKNVLRAAATAQIVRTVTPALEHAKEPYTLTEMLRYVRDVHNLLRQATPAGTALHSVMSQRQTVEDASREVRRAWTADRERRRNA